MLKYMIIDDEERARKKMKTMLKPFEEISFIGEAGDGLEAIEKIEELNPDLIFLDIQMPKLDGFGVISQLSIKPPEIIFVTAYDQYALKAFEYQALNFLLKPVDHDKLKLSIQRACEVLSSLKETDLSQLQPKNLKRVVLRRKAIVKLKLAVDLPYFYSDGGYTYTVLESKPYEVKYTLNQLEKGLTEDFFRVNRSFIINLAYVDHFVTEGLNDTVVMMQDGKSIDLSRGSARQLKKLLGT